MTQVTSNCQTPKHPKPFLTTLLLANLNAAQIFPFLQRDICNRAAGSSAAYDATFSTAKQCLGDAGAIVFIFGALGHILTYGAVPNESTSSILPMVCRYAVICFRCV